MKQVYFVFFELIFSLKGDITKLLGLEVGIMSDICTCCGKKVSFLDVDYDFIKIGNREYRLCAKCRNKINLYIDGNIPIEEVISDGTDKNVADHIRNIKSEEDIAIENQEKKRIENKIIAQKNDPLYDDIHQIAGDLRFIKNLIIIGLV